MLGYYTANSLTTVKGGRGMMSLCRNICRAAEQHVGVRAQRLVVGGSTYAVSQPIKPVGDANLPPVFVNNVWLGHKTLVHRRIVCNCFCAIKAELNSCD